MPMKATSLVQSMFLKILSMCKSTETLKNQKSVIIVTVYFHRNYNVIRHILTYTAYFILYFIKVMLPSVDLKGVS